MLRGSKLLKNGRRGWTRTSDPQLRRLMLYPPELRARNPKPGIYGSEAPFYNVLNYRRVFTVNQRKR